MGGKNLRELWGIMGVFKTLSDKDNLHTIGGSLGG